MKRRYGWRAGWLALGACLIAMGVGCGCGRSEAPEGAEPRAAAPDPTAAAQPEPTQPASEGELLARMETSMGTIVLRLHEQKAPNTVANFVHLASSGFYDGVIFHRVIDGFMIQGGCPQGTGRGGPGWRIADEFAADLRHDRAGVLSMANAGPDTGGSQFFITLGPTPHLDGKHAVFGEVVEGMDVLTAIGKLKTAAMDRPIEPPRIERIVLLRGGQEVVGVQPKPVTVQGARRAR